MRPVRSRLALERANCSFRYLCRYHELPACPPARPPACRPARPPACLHVPYSADRSGLPPARLPAFPPACRPSRPAARPPATASVNAITAATMSVNQRCVVLEAVVPAHLPEALSGCDRRRHRQVAREHGKLQFQHQRWELHSSRQLQLSQMH